MGYASSRAIVLTAVLQCATLRADPRERSQPPYQGALDDLPRVDTGLQPAPHVFSASPLRCPPLVAQPPRVGPSESRSLRSLRICRRASTASPTSVGCLSVARPEGFTPTFAPLSTVRYAFAPAAMHDLRMDVSATQLIPSEGSLWSVKAGGAWAQESVLCAAPACGCASSGVPLFPFPCLYRPLNPSSSLLGD